jgi:5-methylcytosine-specific restriction endonuclease McrA
VSIKKPLKNFKALDPCIVCFEEGENKVCLHHVKTRKSGGPNESWNLMPLCQSCHNEVHMIGLNSFSQRYHQVKAWLLDNMWELNSEKVKWHHFEVEA